MSRVRLPTSSNLGSAEPTPSDFGAAERTPTDLVPTPSDLDRRSRRTEADASLRAKLLVSRTAKSKLSLPHLALARDRTHKRRRAHQARHAGEPLAPLRERLAQPPTPPTSLARKP